MEKTITEILYCINEKKPIRKELMANAINNIIRLNVDQRNICLGEIFTGLLVSDPSSREVHDLLEAIFAIDGYNREQQPFHKTKRQVIEYIGSGKKGIKTINISTPSALVASAAGACILKKGSRATSSLTGSADFMTLIGANIEMENELVDEALDKIGFAFVNIEKLIPKFDNIYNGRFLVPHVLSLGLPAIVTPIRGDKVVYGLSHSEVRQSAQVLQRFSINGTVISTKLDDVHYIDEICPIGEAKFVGILSENKMFSYELKDIAQGHAINFNDLIQRRSQKENVLTTLNILNGRGSITQEVTICLNAALLLLVNEKVNSLNEGIALAQDTIHQSKGIKKLEEFLEFTKSNMDTYYALKRESLYV